MAAIPVLNEFGPGLGNRVNQPNLNFAPQAGIAWDPGKVGKTVLRAGIGLFYENSIWNNELFDRPPRLPSGIVPDQSDGLLQRHWQRFYFA